MTIKEDHIWLKWINTWFDFFMFIFNLTSSLITYFSIYRPYTFKTILKILVIYTSLCQDAVQATVIACYCIQVQLLKYQLQFLRERLVQRTIQPLDWMRVQLYPFYLNIVEHNKKTLVLGNK